MPDPKLDIYTPEGLEQGIDEGFLQLTRLQRTLDRMRAVCNQDQFSQLQFDRMQTALDERRRELRGMKVVCTRL
jgi:hypothetical protein